MTRHRLKKALRATILDLIKRYITSTCLLFHSYSFILSLIHDRSCVIICETQQLPSPPNLPRRYYHTYIGVYRSNVAYGKRTTVENNSVLPVLNEKSKKKYEISSHNTMKVSVRKQHRWTYVLYIYLLAIPPTRKASERERSHIINCVESAAYNAIILLCSNKRLENITKSRINRIFAYEVIPKNKFP